MPEVICLISSSPPSVFRRAKTPSPTRKPRNRAAKLTAVTATFDLTGDTPAPAPKTKKTYADSTFSAAAPHNDRYISHLASVKAQKLQPAKTSTSDANAKMNGQDFVFVEDDDDAYSSGIDLSKEYSLHLSQVKERTRARVAAAQVEKNAPASSPVAVKTSNSVKPIEKPNYKSPLKAATRKTLPNSVAQASYRYPVTALNKPLAMGNKEYVFLNDDFSSSIDVDKEYDLGSPAQKRRKVTPQPETYKMRDREKEKHGLPGLFSAPEVRRTETTAKEKELEKHGLPDLSSPLGSMRRQVADALKGVEKHGLLDLFSSPGTKQKEAARPAREIVNHSLPDSFSPSPGRTKSTQAQVDAATMKAFVSKSTASEATFNEASLPDPYNPSPKREISKQDLVDVATRKAFLSKTTAHKVSTNEASLPQPFKRTQDRVLDSDPITFTSSPDFAQMEKYRRQRHGQALAKARQLCEVGEPAPKPSNVSAALEAVDSDSDELPELPSLTKVARTLSRTKSDTSYLKSAGTAPPRSKPLARSKSMANPTAKPKKRVPKTDDEKAAEKANKEAAKEAEAEKKRLVREAKARDKIIAQDLAKVNTLKTDKKKSTPEMIVLFPQEMDKKLREAAEGFLAVLSVEYGNWAGAGATLGEVADSGMVKNVVRWKRKVDAVHNEREDIWEPVPRRIENEKHVLVHLLAKEFVELATADENKDLNKHALKLKARFYDHKVIYLIEGLSSWQKKNANLRNRQFTAAVRAQATEEAPSSSQTTTLSRSRKKKPQPEYISDNIIEDALLSLQIKHKVLIHHTASLVESAEWISIFTQHISTIPYRLQKMNLDTSFCMESGQVRAGENARDTFVKMLCEMRGVTTPVAWGVEAEIGGGVKQLVERFRREGKEALAMAKKGANRDGAFTDRNVGKAISKRIHNVFMGRDPGSTDV